MQLNFFFEMLYKHEVKYVLCGGLAVNIYGVPRSTADVDLIIELTEINVERFEIAIKTMDYSPLIPVPLKNLCDEPFRKKMLAEKNLIAYSYSTNQPPFIPVDVLIECSISFEDLWNRKSIRKAGGYEFYVVSETDLIAMKKQAARKQDDDDIENLGKKYGK